MLTFFQWVRREKLVERLEIRALHAAIEREGDRSSIRTCMKNLVTVTINGSVTYYALTVPRYLKLRPTTKTSRGLPVILLY